MIMDIANQQRNEINISPQGENMIKNEYPTMETRKPSLKRSFDVAFLMMPDDKLQQKQLEKQARLEEIVDRRRPTDLSPRQNLISEAMINQEFFNNNETRRYPQITVRSPRIYDDPSIIPEMDNPKSAFTKVAQPRMESPIPPPPLSPDQLSCPSMSPPISTTPPRTNGAYPVNFRPEYTFNGPFQSVGQMQALAAQNNRIKQHFMYRPVAPNGSPELLPGYLPAAAFPFANPNPGFPPQPDITGIVRNPAAAAILTTLIPPTLASTFSLTAQNVCAKCNISFRMTSDLVYHMRSHHKSEVASDPNRRKREEKLKCPVCNESFRERHHLTRHMTAHQDKESDSQIHIEDHTQRRK